MTKRDTFFNYLVLLAMAMWAAATSNWLALFGFALAIFYCYLATESVKLHATALSMIARLIAQLKAASEMMVIAEELLAKAYKKDNKNG